MDTEARGQRPISPLGSDLMRVHIAIACFLFLLSLLPATASSANDEAWRTYTRPKAYPPGSPFDMTDGLPYSLSYYLDWVRQLGHSNLIIGERPGGDQLAEGSGIRGKKSSETDWLLADGTVAVWIRGVPAPDSTGEILLAVRPATGEIEVLNGIALLLRVPPRSQVFEAQVGDFLHFSLGGSKSNSTSAEIRGETVKVLFNDNMESLILSCDRPGTATVQLSEIWWNDPVPRQVQTCELRIHENRSGPTPSEELLLYLNGGQGDAEKVREFIQHGADVNFTEPTYRLTPLHNAIHYGHQAVFQLLLEAGADPLQANGEGNTPLYIAVHQGQKDMVKTLLKHQVNVNQANIYGFTPLRAAARSGDLELIRLLLAHGASPAAKDNKGRTPADIAREFGHTGAVSLLEGSPGDLKSPVER